MASQSSGDNIPNGQFQTRDNWSEFSRVAFVIMQALSKMQTCLPVKIVAVNNAGELSPVGLLDVVPLINQIDNQGKAVPHETIYNIPYFRVQGGANAVIIDPEVGDIGICCFASRDISRFKNTKDQANPGSLRQFSFSDGIYIGGILNGTPEQYVQFNSSGIKIYSPNLVNLEAPDVQINCETFELTAETSASIDAPETAIDCETMSIVATTSTTITTPTFTVNGISALNGAIGLNGPITQAAGSGAASLLGPLSVTNSLTAASVTADTITSQGKILHSHVHADPQGGSTDPPT